MTAGSQARGGIRQGSGQVVDDADAAAGAVDDEEPPDEEPPDEEPFDEDVESDDDDEEDEDPEEDEDDPELADALLSGPRLSVR